MFVDRPSPVSNGQSPLSSDQIIVKVNITLPHLNCECKDTVMPSCVYVCVRLWVCVPALCSSKSLHTV